MVQLIIYRKLPGDPAVAGKYGACKAGGSNAAGPAGAALRNCGQGHIEVDYGGLKRIILYTALFGFPLGLQGEGTIVVSQFVLISRLEQNVRVFYLPAQEGGGA